MIIERRDKKSRKDKNVKDSTTIIAKNKQLTFFEKINKFD